MEDYGLEGRLYYVVKPWLQINERKKEEKGDRDGEEKESGKQDRRPESRRSQILHTESGCEWTEEFNISSTSFQSNDLKE